MTKNSGDFEATLRTPSGNQKSFTFRPDFRAIDTWEDQTGLSSTDLIMQMGKGGMKLSHMARILTAAIKSGGQRMDEDAAMRLIQSNPPADIGNVIVGILKRAHMVTDAEGNEPAASDPA